MTDEFYIELSVDLLAHGAYELPWRLTVKLDLYLSETVRWQGFFPVEYDERKYEISSIPAPFTLGLSDLKTDEYVEMRIDPDDRIAQFTRLEWNESGTAIRIQDIRQYGWIVPGEKYIWGNFWKGLGREFGWRLVPFGFFVLAVLGLTLERIWIRPKTWLCDRCGYDLRGSATGACPECGKGYVVEVDGD